jgi:hypothetical protein
MNATDQRLQKQWDNIQKAQSKTEAKTNAAPGGHIAGENCASASWLDALAQRWARQLCEMERECDTNDVMIPRVEVFEACLNELRAEMKNASNPAINCEESAHDE